MDNQPVQSSISEPIVTPVQPSETKTRSPVIPVLLVILLLLLASTAFLYYQNMQLKNMLASYKSQSVVSPTPIVYQSPTPSTTTDPTVNWKKINAKYWTFKVPETWFYIKCLGGTSIILGPNLSKEFRDVNIECNFGIRDFLSVDRITDKFSIPVTTSPDQNGIYTVVSDKKDILIDGQRAIEQTEKVYGNQMEGTHLVVYIQGNGFTDVLTFWNINTNAKKDTIDQILSTFKFLSTSKIVSERKFGYIKSITPVGDFYNLSVDVASYANDNSRPNGFRIDNPSTDLTTLPLEQNPIVIVQTFSHAADGNFNFNQTISFSDFLSKYQSDSTLKNIPYWLDLENGTITKITEQYIP